jgi:hypothetical protein
VPYRLSVGQESTVAKELRKLDWTRINSCTRPFLLIWDYWTKGKMIELEYTLAELLALFWKVWETQGDDSCEHMQHEYTCNPEISHSLYSYMNYQEILHGNKIQHRPWTVCHNKTSEIKKWESREWRKVCMAHPNFSLLLPFTNKVISVPPSTWIGDRNPEKILKP